MNTEVMAIYFPSWHPDRHYEQWYGKGFSEWELVKSTKPLFEGHLQPKIPKWGYFDESDPEWGAKQIDLAADHGITGFIFDWYWYDGVKFLDQALENGFLNSPNRERLKFSLMWANHDWGIWPAISGETWVSGNENQGKEIFLKINHSPEDLIKVTEYCCEKYFSQPNYWQIDGRPVFSIYNLETFINKLGSQENARAGLELMQNTVRQCGFKGLYFLGNIGCCDDNEYCCGWDRVAWAKELGFESVFAYNIVRSKSYNQIPDEMPVYDYGEVIESHEFCWDKISQGGLNHFPSVTMGLDVSPRWDRNTRPPMDFKKLHYEPIVLDNTPDRFGELFGKGIEKARNESVPAVIINAWNEWTEGMFLLPEKQYGTGYLEAIKQVLNIS